MASSPTQNIAVIGAGPVGSLAALYAARRGYNVSVYELRSDLRDPSIVPLNFTKSINLALSQRGITALRHADPAHAASESRLLNSILADTIPMYGRMIHSRSKATASLTQQSQQYDAHGRFIRAADRGGLNKALLDELERLPNVKLCFNHKLTGADFDRNVAWLEDRTVVPAPTGPDSPRPPEIEVAFDLVIGADGAHSAVRQHLMKFIRMSYMQEYIDTLWCEFHMEPLRGEFAISPNHLHIWPAGTFMFIAIPSTDRSFTCTLFMSSAQFSAIDKDPASLLIPFFRDNFPGVIEGLIPAEQLLAQYSRNPHLPLISIKCDPYHAGGSAVIVGDAAHAMVPFYGQGMNAGLEDVRVLFECIDKHVAKGASQPREKSSAPFAAALEEYTTNRRPDAHTINDLAMGNFQEMGDRVRSPLYLLRKRVEEFLSVWMPVTGFKTQYSRVSFSDQRYSEVVRDVAWQSTVLGYGGLGITIAALGVAGRLGSRSQSVRGAFSWLAGLVPR